MTEPAGIINSSMDGNVRRAIDFRQGEKLVVRGLKALGGAAVALNVAGKKPKAVAQSRPEENDRHNTDRRKTRAPAKRKA